MRFLWLCSGFGRSGLALGSGLFPICQKGAKQLFGVGCGLIHSILETPKAPSHPHPFRVGVPGISTFPKQNAQTSPLVSKGDIVERYIVLTTLLYTIPMCVCWTPPPPPNHHHHIYIRWLHGLIDTYGGVQPDTAEVHVPAGNKSDVKGWYDEEVHGGNEDLTPVSNQHFQKVWRTCVPHLKCRAFLRLVCCYKCTLVLPRKCDALMCWI